MALATSSSPDKCNDKEMLQTNRSHLPIRNSRLKRFLILLAEKTSARFYRRQGVCVPLSKKLILKAGPHVHLTEAATMEFVAEHTSIPLPKVHCSFVHKNRTYIVMERIDGDMVASVWHTLSEDSRQHVCAQLRRMLEELRALKPPPGTGVESTIGGSLCDIRMPRPKERFGPFKAINDFHLWLRDGLQPATVDAGKRAVTEEEWEEIVAMTDKQDTEWGPPVFTHADLNPCNILVRGDTVVGIIDWEFSGWYPHYWEYTSAYLGNTMRTDWLESLPSFLDPDPACLQMERTRQKWWGEF